MIFEFLSQSLKKRAVAVVLSMPCGAGGLGGLAGFRDGLFRCLTARADALMDLTDAVLCADGPVRSLAELSLVPEFRRGHGALYDALAEGGADEERLRDLLASALPPGLPLLFAVDLTTWERPAAHCSPGRTHGHAPCRCAGKGKSVPGWVYSRVTGVEWGTSSWVYPVDAVRVRCGDDQAGIAGAQVTALVARLEAGGRCGRPGQPVPVAVFDAGYAPAAVTWALRDVRAQVLVRLRDAGRRVFRAAPPPRAPGAGGAPRLHGQRRRLAEWQGWPPPDQEQARDTARYGHVTVRAWHGLHQEVQARGYFASRPLPAGTVIEGTVIQVTAERLPDGRIPGEPMWLWHAAPAGVPCDLDLLWRGYLRRFDVEHGFRFDKGTLGWTSARPRTPQQADLWTWLVIAAYAQLQLARSHAPDLRRPWERPPPPGKDPSPTRVRRGFRHIRARLGTPARVPKPSRPGPGRPKGSTTGPAKRYPVEKRTDQDTKGPDRQAG
jgi:DDE superfamily endonuclease